MEFDESKTAAPSQEDSETSSSKKVEWSEKTSDAETLVEPGKKYVGFQSGHKIL
jgi:hypothetical protein